jgi:hypothetical protein
VVIAQTEGMDGAEGQAQMEEREPGDGG